MTMEGTLRIHREQMEAILAAMPEEVDEVVLEEGKDGRLLVKKVEKTETLRPLSITTRRQRVSEPEPALAAV